MKRIFVIAILFFSAFTACEDLEHENVIPDEAARLTDLQQQYQELLVAAPNGWYIEYQPIDSSPLVSVHMTFSEDGKVKIISDMYGFYDEMESTYRIAGVIRPELIFDTYSVWSVLAQNSEGSFEFLIRPEDDGNMTLTHVLGNNTEKEFSLQQADSEMRDEVIAKSSVSRLLYEFNQNSSAYFKNVILENISAFWELDINTQQLRLSWESEEHEIVSKDFVYSNLPNNGIRLSEPWQSGSVEVSEIYFGESDENTLEITSAGTAGTGQIEVAHIPAFPYQGMVDFFLQEGGDERFYASTLATAEDFYSPLLLEAYTALKASVGADTYNLQLYNNNSGFGPSSVQFRYVMPDGDSGWMAYRYEAEKIDESHVVITPDGTSSSNAAPYIDEVLEFMEYIFPEEGVTIVPVGRSGSLQLLRLISRRDSRYYLTVRVGTPAGVYFD
ncbi:DUF4302 domain-containing protein [Sinomicrobium sp.]